MYIHELNDWPAFHWQTDKIANLLAQVRHRQGKLLGKMESLGFQVQAEAVLQSLTQEILKSSEIEGEELNNDQVRSSIARRLGIDIGALTPAARNVEGIVELMLDATQHHAKKLTATRLLKWHEELFAGADNSLSNIKIGAWRDDASGPMQVVSGAIGRERVHFQAPPAKLLGKEMRAFLKWFNSGMPIDPVLKAAIAHFWFVTIHPFDDGNGRIARAIADMQLARSEASAQRFYSMSAQIRAERKHYYQILEQTQKGALDITAWLEWFLSCLERAFDSTEKTLATVLNKSRFWHKHAEATFNQRQRDTINKLFNGFEGKLTSSKWAKLNNCSSDTALRDIDDLVARGILVKGEGGGRSTSYRLVSI